MTERWRKKLGDLDNTGPSEDVFERAKEGPTHPDEAVVGPKMTTRVGTVVVAFAVFALAISVFAIPALRMGGEQAAAGGSLFPVWPAQSSDDLQQLQADADAGNAAWALAPKSVVQQFGQQVMGWPDAFVSEADMVGCTTNYPTGVVMSGPPTSVGISCVATPATASAYQGPPGAAPSDATGGPSNAGGFSTGGFRQFLVWENLDTTGDMGYTLAFQEVVVVYQPLEQGDGQIWAVLEARSPNVEMSVGSGQTVHDGASISAGFNTNLEPTLGYSACDQSVASSLFHSPGGAGKGIEMTVSFPASASCSGQMPGYVWATSSSQSLAGPDGSVLVDPLVGPPPEGLAGLTAEPIVAVFSETGAVTSAIPTPTETASDLPLTGTTYTDPEGWTIAVPPNWTTQPSDNETNRGATFVGDDGMSVHVVRILGAKPSDDSQFPLTVDDLSNIEGGFGGDFFGDGKAFTIFVHYPSYPGPLTAAEKETLSRLMKSIRFAPWQLGETRDGFTAVGKVLPAATAEWLTFSGDHYVASYDGDGGRALLGPAPACAEGEGTYEIRETGEAGITCTNGTAATWKANWDFATGAPKAGNPADFGPLATHLAVLSWDGWLLARLPQS